MGTETRPCVGRGRLEAGEEGEARGLVGVVVTRAVVAVVVVVGEEGEALTREATECGTVKDSKWTIYRRMRDK